MKNIPRTLDQWDLSTYLPQEEAKPAKAEDHGKMDHMNIYKRMINNKSFFSINIQMHKTIQWVMPTKLIDLIKQPKKGGKTRKKSI